MAKTREPVIPRGEALQALAGWGYFGPVVDGVLGRMTESKFTAAVKRYQKFNGLKPDGWIGPVTAHLIDNPLRCGLPDMMANDRAKWPMTKVSFHSRLRLGLSDAGAVFAQAAAQWNAVCGIELFAVNSTACNILADEGMGAGDNLDGRGGTLAWSYLPNGRRDQKIQQKYDRAENWTDQMLLAVACHELGHAIGLPHLAAGNLLQPYYKPDLTAPQKGDITEVVARYGKPSSTPPVIPPTSPGAVLISTQVDEAWNVVVTVDRGGERRTAAGPMKPIGMQQSRRRRQGVLS